MSVSQSLLWLLATPFISALLIYLVGRIVYRWTRRASSKNPIPVARWLALLAMAPIWMALINLSGPILAGGSVEVMVGSVPMRMDGIGFALAITALGLGSLVTIFSFPYMAGEEGEEKYYALLTALIGTIIGLGSANDLFNLWVWFEAMAVTTYLLVAFYTHERGALEAGLKYLVQSAVGSVLVLMAIAITFAQTGTLRLDEIAAWDGVPSLLLLAAGVQFFIGFGVKAALVPLHTWLPDAHSQAPSGISAMLSGVVIEAGLIAMLRALGNLPGNSNTWGILLLAFGALNMLIGNLMALRQSQIKRLLAYSSLAHVGYMMLGFGAAAVFHNDLSAMGGFAHLFTHAMMKGLAFLAAGALMYSLYISKGSHAPLIKDDLNGICRGYPLEAFCFSVAVLALGSLPPLAGFMSKWQIFVGGVSTQNVPLIILIVFGALNGVFSLSYYAPLVNRIYRKDPGQNIQSIKPSSAWMKAPIAILTLMVVAIGFWPAIMQAFTGPAAATYISLFGGQILLAGF